MYARGTQCISGGNPKWQMSVEASGPRIVVGQLLPSVMIVNQRIRRNTADVENPTGDFSCTQVGNSIVIENWDGMTAMSKVPVAILSAERRGMSDTAHVLSVDTFTLPP